MWATGFHHNQQHNDKQLYQEASVHVGFDGFVQDEHWENKKLFAKVSGSWAIYWKSLSKNEDYFKFFIIAKGTNRTSTIVTLSGLSFSLSCHVL